MENITSAKNVFDLLQPMFVVGLSMTHAQLKFLKGVLKEARRIQPLFDPEPKLKMYGVGTMRSRGTSVMERIKSNVAKRSLAKS